MELDTRQPAIFRQRLCSIQLRILKEGLNGLFPPFGIPRREVDKESGVGVRVREGGGGITEGEVAD